MRGIFELAHQINCTYMSVYFYIMTCFSQPFPLLLCAG